MSFVLELVSSTVVDLHVLPSDGVQVHTTPIFVDSTVWTIINHEINLSPLSELKCVC